MMSYTYADRKRSKDASPEKEAAQAQPSMDALRSGASLPTQEQMGHRVDLPDAMRAKMENAFGADLGAVKLYESQAVADAGAKAVTRGSDIAFAPGMLDFSSYGGQALLGHELSHVVSQARGEVTGGGFLNDQALEARADREGAMAASGQTVAMPTAAMSGVTAAAAAGPMQAKKLSYEQKFDPASRDNLPKPSMKEKLDWRTEQMSWKGGLVGKLGKLGQKALNREDKLPKGEVYEGDPVPGLTKEQEAAARAAAWKDEDFYEGDEIPGLSDEEKNAARAAAWGDEDVVEGEQGPAVSPEMQEQARLAAWGPEMTQQYYMMQQQMMMQMMMQQMMMQQSGPDEIDQLAKTTEEFDADLPENQIDRLAKTSKEFDADLMPKKKKGG